MYYFRPLSTNQSVSYTATAGTSSAVGAQTYAVLLHATTDAYVTFDGTATATNSVFLKANEPYTFLIHPSETVSVVQVASGGTLYVSELTR